MTRLVTWINQSTDYNGTEIFRDTTLDPQNLPAPVATVGPAAQGARVEWKDPDGSGDQCYLVRDFDDQGVGEASEAYCYDEDPFSGAQIGDEIQGGIYAGTITYADGRVFHIVAAKASGEGIDLIWSSDTSTTTGANDPDDGLANQQEILNIHDNGSHTAFYHCRDYTGGGYEDWYLPSRNEITLLYNNLADHTEFSDNASSNQETWSSTESNADEAWMRLFSNGTEFDYNKDYVNPRTRPIRRVAV